MSANEIQALCELYIGRKFDENDSQSLREFLRDLQVQKPKKVAAEKEEHHDNKKFVPVSERKQHLVREYAPGDRPAPVALTDVGAAGGAKERMAAYNNQVNAAAGSGPSASANRVAEDLPAATKVSERKAQWAAETGLSPRPPNADEAVKERLADVSGVPGVKDRLGAWNNATAEHAADKHLVEERTADVKGVAGVKERLGNWNKLEDSGAVPSNTAARVEEVKGAPGVKDRLGAWNNVTADNHVESKTAERLAELQGASAVKSRAEGWNTQGDAVVTSGALAEERTAELKRGTSVRDRMNSYSKAANEVKVQKTEIYIPQDVSELPTKESQGQ